VRRREFIALVGSAAAAWPAAARAQQRDRLPVVGYLAANSETTDRPRRGAFAQRLGELGWIDGRNVRTEYRWADASLARAADLAVELVQLPVDVIVTNGDAFVLAARRATTKIPIVFPAAGDPVGNGLVASLARPGGNVTGLSLQLTDTVGKRLGLLRELLPSLRRLAVAFNVADPQVNSEREAVFGAVRSLGFEMLKLEMRPNEDFAPAIESLKGRADALYVCLDPFTVINASRINASALSIRLPTMHGVRQNAEAGGLISYGPDFPDMSRRTAEIVDKILRGASPADIPVEQPTKFDLVINLKIAQSLGIGVPQTLLARADEVIE
jgi:putative ABC transport system substrate-binding protein